MLSSTYCNGIVTNNNMSNTYVLSRAMALIDEIDRLLKVIHPW